MEMNWDDIRDAACLAGFGDEIPPKLRAVIERVMKYKNVFHPEPFTTSDWAYCAFVYQTMRAKENKNG